MSDPPEVLDTLTGEVRGSWQRFLDVFEPLRPELYRYCRYLTRDAWDAEDLVQDTLARGFVTLGTLFHELPNPRAWLFRVASNLFVDRQRRVRRDVRARRDPDPVEEGDAVDPRAAREAAATLIGRLSPQERAGVVLKDVFDFTVEEIAEVLSTTPGAVKAALHRGRGKLAAEPDDATAEGAPSPDVVDAFCEAFNARDLERLTGLLLDSATVRIMGVVTEYGKDAPKDPFRGSFAGSLGPIGFDERGGIGPEHLEGYRGALPRAEARVHRGERIVLVWFAHDDGDAVRSVMRIASEGGHVAALTNYFFTPDVIAEICRELGVAFRTNGYRYW